MSVILQKSLPTEMLGPRSLPGVAPCAPGDWLRVDEVYAEQLAYREHLLDTRQRDVHWLDPTALPAAQEVLEEALPLLSGLGFAVSGAEVTRPDGVTVPLDHDAPLLTLGRLTQEDICLMQKRGDQHVLTGAVLCFPANWRLAEKAGRPLIDIHAPVEDYDDDVARRVQRLFDGVRAGRPLWRFNRLQYADADLHQPWRRTTRAEARFVRSERQCVVRMPRSDAVVFSIHTFVVPIENAATLEARAIPS